MADFSALKQSIQNYIKQNGNKEITGAILQKILLSMVTTMGDGAINDNASDISDIKGDIQNINGSITDINGLFSAITTRLNTGALYAGYATPSTTPAALTSQEVFYLATQAGTYTNFHFNGGDDPIVLTKDGIYFIVSGTDDDDWNAEPILLLDEVPTASSNNAVKSGGVAEELALGAVYDVSAKNPTAGPNNDGKWESLSALLLDANLNTIIPISVRKGGMSIKFVQSSDNNYIQFRCMSDEFTTDVTQWQGVDDLPTAGSDNLVKSGGIFETISSLSKKIGGLLFSKTENINSVNTNYLTVTLSEIGIEVGDVVTIKFKTSDTVLYNVYYTTSSGRTGIGQHTGSCEYENYTVPSNATGFQIYAVESPSGTPITIETYVNGSINDTTEEIERKVSNNSKGFCYNETFNTLPRGNDIYEPTLESLEVGVGDRLFVNIECNNNVTYNLYFYDSNNTNVQVIATVKSGSGVFEVTVPNNAHHFRLYLMPNATSYNVDFNIIKLATKTYVDEKIAPINSALQLKEDIFKKSYEVIDYGINGSNLWYPSPGWKTMFVPVNPGDMVSWYNHAIGVTRMTFLKSNSYATMTSPDYSDYTNTIYGFDYTKYVSETFTNREVPSDTHYLAFMLCLDGNPVIPNIIINGIDITKTLVQVLETEEYPINVYKPILSNLNRSCGNGGTPGSTNYKRLVFLHYSDIHHDNRRNKRVIAFYQKFKSQLKDILLTGDIAGGAWEPTLDEDFYHADGMTNVLKVIGNHDVVGGDNPAPTAQEMYERYFENIENWGVEQPTGASDNGLLYYYKDYNTEKIRLICLNDYSFNSDQRTWLADVLEDARLNNMAVIIAKHEPPVNYSTQATLFNTSFTSLEYTPESNRANGVSEVDAFISNGGEFVCWLTGHMHSDFCGKFGEYNQVFITIAASMINYENGIDFAREWATPYEDCFNLVSIDRYSGTISIYRVGANFDRLLRHREAMVIDYKNAALLSSY